MPTFALTELKVGNKVFSNLFVEIFDNQLCFTHESRRPTTIVLGAVSRLFRESTNTLYLFPKWDFCRQHPDSAPRLFAALNQKDPKSVIGLSFEARIDCDMFLQEYESSSKQKSGAPEVQLSQSSVAKGAFLVGITSIFQGTAVATEPPLTPLVPVGVAAMKQQNRDTTPTIAGKSEAASGVRAPFRPVSPVPNLPPPDRPSAVTDNAKSAISVPVHARSTSGTVTAVADSCVPDANEQVAAGKTSIATREVEVAKQPTAVPESIAPNPVIPTVSADQVENSSVPPPAVHVKATQKEVVAAKSSGSRRFVPPKSSAITAPAQPVVAESAIVPKKPADASNGVVDAPDNRIPSSVVETSVPVRAPAVTEAPKPADEASSKHISEPKMPLPVIPSKTAETFKKESALPLSPAPREALAIPPPESPKSSIASSAAPIRRRNATKRARSASPHMPECPAKRQCDEPASPPADQSAKDMAANSAKVIKGIDKARERISSSTASSALRESFLYKLQSIADEAARSKVDDSLRAKLQSRVVDLYEEFRSAVEDEQNQAKASTKPSRTKATPPGVNSSKKRKPVDEVVAGNIIPVSMALESLQDRLAGRKSVPRERRASQPVERSSVKPARGRAPSQPAAKSRGASVSPAKFPSAAIPLASRGAELTPLAALTFDRPTDTLAKSVEKSVRSRRVESSPPAAPQRYAAPPEPIPLRQATPEPIHATNTFDGEGFDFGHVGDDKLSDDGPMDHCLKDLMRGGISHVGSAVSAADADEFVPILQALMGRKKKQESSHSKEIDSLNMRAGSLETSMLKLQASCTQSVNPLQQVLREVIRQSSKDRVTLTSFEQEAARKVAALKREAQTRDDAISKLEGLIHRLQANTAEQISSLQREVKTLREQISHTDIAQTKHKQSESTRMRTTLMQMIKSLS